MDFEHKVSEFMGKMSADIDNMKSDITEIKEGFSDYRALKNRIFGACIFISATAGASISAVWKKLTG